MMDFLRKNNLVNNKHIPHNYKCNDRTVQLELLAGLIDSDGYYHDNCYEIIQKNYDSMYIIIYSAFLALYDIVIKAWAEDQGE